MEFTFFMQYSMTYVFINVNSSAQSILYILYEITGQSIPCGAFIVYS